LAKTDLERKGTAWGDTSRRERIRGFSNPAQNKDSLREKKKRIKAAGGSGRGGRFTSVLKDDYVHRCSREKLSAANSDVYDGDEERVLIDPNRKRFSERG